MTRFRPNGIALVAVALALTAGVATGLAQSDDSGSRIGTGANAPRLDLTAAQRTAIYAAVSKDASKAASQRFPPVVGADVPPMIELYALPEGAAAANPAVKFYQYTLVQDRVVLVDPTKMRVVDVIGPEPGR